MFEKDRIRTHCVTINKVVELCRSDNKMTKQSQYYTFKITHTVSRSMNICQFVLTFKRLEHHTSDEEQDVFLLVAVDGKSRPNVLPLRHPRHNVCAGMLVLTVYCRELALMMITRW